MRLVVNVSTNRIFFTITIVDGKHVLYEQRKRWIEIEDANVSDIQRKYLVAINALEHLQSMHLRYEECILHIDSKLVKQQLSGKKSTTNVFIASMKSKLIGLMTIQGVTIEKCTAQ